MKMSEVLFEKHVYGSQIALYFWGIFRRIPTTPPHHLVQHIIDPKPINCAVTEWGKTHEACALEE